MLLDGKVGDHAHGMSSPTSIAFDRQSRHAAQAGRVPVCGTAQLWSASSLMMPTLQVGVGYLVSSLPTGLPGSASSAATTFQALSPG